MYHQLAARFGRNAHQISGREALDNEALYRHVPSISAREAHGRDAREHAFFFSDVDGPAVLNESSGAQPIYIGPALLATQDEAQRNRESIEWSGAARKQRYSSPAAVSGRSTHCGVCFKRGN